MSQVDVLNYLKERKTKWISSETIRKKLNISQGSIALNMLKLRKNNFVLFKKILSDNKGTKLYLYKYKR